MTAITRDLPAPSSTVAPPPAALPSPVKWALGIEVLVVGLGIFNGINGALHGIDGALISLPIVFLVDVLLIWGVYSGALLARNLVLLGAGLMVTKLPFEAYSLGTASPIWLLVIGVFFVLRAWQIHLLTRPAAKVHYGMDCPDCGSLRSKGASLLYGKLRCRACDHVWLRGERERLQVDLFD